MRIYYRNNYSKFSSNDSKGPFLHPNDEVAIKQIVSRFKNKIIFARPILFHNVMYKTFYLMKNSRRTCKSSHYYDIAQLTCFKPRFYRVSLHFFFGLLIARHRHHSVVCLNVHGYVVMIAIIKRGDVIQFNQHFL